MYPPLSRREALGLAAGLALDASAGARWRRLPDLPLALGGQFAGVHNGALIVAGGSRFPVSKWEGGAKQWEPGLFVLPDVRSGWLRFSLPRPLAYGGSVSHRRGVLLIGGSDESSNHPVCYWLRWTGKAVEVERAPDLPSALANCVAALTGAKAYVFGGQSAPEAATASNALFSLNLDEARGAWQPEAPLPGPGRILATAACVDGKLYVAGGGALLKGSGGAPARRYLRDAWQYAPGAGWRALPDLPEPTCAAPGVGLSGRFLVIGGSDGVLAPRESELRDAHPGFSRALKVYHPSRAKWRSAGPLPFSLVTTTAVVWNDLVVIPGGEDRPAHRSAAVYAIPASELTL